MSEGVRRWERGRSTVAELLARKELQRVTADRAAADRMIAAARTHLVSAARIRSSDPTMAVAFHTMPPETRS